ncbi:MAG TPA: bifunctional ADP-heptose synthase [Chitinophagaceae bacterium]|nr:bifunctional ADP-heptose synthase [Chitinophagaceae bacterium]
MDINKLFGSFLDIRVGVIGDVMLDTYMWGHVERISPEAPVPVVSLNNKEYRIGGAGNVALNIASLGAKASILSVTGNDDDGRQLRDMFAANGIDTRYLIGSNERITTNKMRIISRNQQMMRLDSEITDDLGNSDEQKLFDAAVEFIRNEKPSVIIFEDYNKGVLKESLIRSLIDLCRKEGVITAVDPKRKNFFTYKQVDIFKPNLKEVKEGLNIIKDGVSKESLDQIHEALNKHLSHAISFITLSERGVYYSDGKNSRIIPSHRRNIADVSGAGDTVIAVASLVYAATHDIDLMGEIANIAGGLVCEDVGTVAINREKLLHECAVLLP